MEILTYKELDSHKKAFIFELDDVLYPERDYLLQVYYLFAHLLEYTETVPPAEDLVAFFQKAYTYHGAAGIFDRAADAFGIDANYRAQFNRLHVQAKLPLPLLLFGEVENLLKAIVSAGKRVFILTKGNPLMQLNKLKQLAWGELAKAIKTYFYDELVIQGYQQPLIPILQENHLELADVLLFGKEDTIKDTDLEHQVDYLPIQKFLNSKHNHIG
ncbi:hypothetical protein GCM10023231_15380 [Olivibacter ginsenosidimutans]|uniref:HAD family hydrolase n=1 Tax=Olivibacter ginsenosidimutans TaxID=1176537 RepID=A0ABP9AYK9_9SPHI